MSESFSPPLDIPNPEQITAENATYKFLRSAIESNPATTLDRRLLGLSAVLIGLGEKDLAVKVIDEVVNTGTFLAEHEHKYGHEEVGKLLYRAGDVVRAKEFLLERKSAFKSGSFSSEDSEDLIFMSRTFVECGMNDVAKEILDKAADKLTNFNDITTRRMYKFIMSSYIKNGWIDEAKVYLTNLEEGINNYKKPQNIYDWHPSVLTDGYLDIAKWTM